MRGMNKWVGASMLAASVALTTAVRAGAADKKIAKEDVPQPVMQSVNARLPGAEFTSAEKENEKGNVVYDLELKHEGLKYEMDVKEDGTIMEIEKQVKHGPKAVLDAVKAKYPNASVKEVMAVSVVKGKQEKLDRYEVTIGTDRKEKEVVVSLDGKSVKEEAD